MKVADHVVFLITINHVWTRARLRDMQEAGFQLKEICPVAMPKEFPQLGFQLGAIYLARESNPHSRQSSILKLTWLS
jgi:hypothetical protein